MDQLLMQSEKLFLSDDKWLLLLREALAALNIALKKVNRLKKYIRKNLGAPTDRSIANNNEESSRTENEDHYFSATTLSQLFQSERGRQSHARRRTNSDVLSNDFSSSTDEIPKNCGFKKEIKSPSPTNLEEDPMENSSVEINYISPQSHNPGSSNGKRSRKRRREERINESTSCLNISSNQEENKTDTEETGEINENLNTHFAESTHSFEHSLCDFSEAESKCMSIAEENQLRVYFKISNNRILDTEVKAELEKEGFHSCFVKVKNKETYSRGYIVFSGDEVEKATAKTFNLCIHNEPLQIRKSIKASSSFSPNSSINSKIPPKITEEYVIDQDSFVNNESEKRSPMSNKEPYNGTNGTFSHQNSSADRVQDVNINIKKEINLLNACSAELMKNVCESFSFAAALTGEGSHETGKSITEIDKSCTENLGLGAVLIKTEKCDFETDNNNAENSRPSATLFVESIQNTEKSSSAYDGLAGRFSEHNTCFSGPNAVKDNTKTERKTSPKQNACSGELIKNVFESFSFAAALIGEGSEEADKSSTEIDKNCNESIRLGAAFIKTEKSNIETDNNYAETSSPRASSIENPEISSCAYDGLFDESVLGANAVKYNTEINQPCYKKISEDTSPKQKVASEICTTKTKDSEECVADNTDQFDIHKEKNSLPDRDENLLINISFECPPVGGIRNRSAERTGSSDSDFNSIDKIKNDNSNDDTKNISKHKNKEFEKSKDKYDNCNQIDESNNYRAELDESTLISMSFGYPSTRDAFPRKGKYNEMGRNSPGRSTNYTSESDTSEAKVINTSKDSAPRKNESLNSDSNPDLKCSNTPRNETTNFNTISQINPNVFNKYSSNLATDRRRLEHNNDNNFNPSNRLSNENFRSNDIRSERAMAESSNRQCFKFHSNENFQRALSHNKRFESYNRQHFVPGRNTGNPHYSKPFSPYKPNHRHENERRNSSHNYNSSWKFKRDERILPRNSF